MLRSRSIGEFACLDYTGSSPRLPDCLYMFFSLVTLQYPLAGSAFTIYSIKELHVVVVVLFEAYSLRDIESGLIR